MLASKEFARNRTRRGLRRLGLRLVEAQLLLQVQRVRRAPLLGAPPLERGLERARMRRLQSKSRQALKAIIFLIGTSSFLLLHQNFSRIVCRVSV